MDVNGITQTVVATVTQVGLRVLGALVLWIIGRALISMAVQLVSRGLATRRIDATIARYLSNILNLAGPVLVVRPYCHTDHCWQVYFDTNRMIRETFGEAAYPVPDQHYAIRSVS
jgi:small-conductance mechanosensitive channel